MPLTSGSPAERAVRLISNAPTNNEFKSSNCFNVFKRNACKYLINGQTCDLPTTDENIL